MMQVPESGVMAYRRSFLCQIVASTVEVKLSGTSNRLSGELYSQWIDKIFLLSTLFGINVEFTKRHLVYVLYCKSLDLEAEEVALL